MAEEFVWTVDCCECGEEFAPSGGAGYKTAYRGTYRYVVGHLCEACMGGRKSERKAPKLGTENGIQRPTSPYTDPGADL